MGNQVEPRDIGRKGPVSLGVGQAAVVHIGHLDPGVLEQRMVQVAQRTVARDVSGASQCFHDVQEPLAARPQDTEIGAVNESRGGFESKKFDNREQAVARQICNASMRLEHCIACQRQGLQGMWCVAETRLQLRQMSGHPVRQWQGLNFVDALAAREIAQWDAHPGGATALPLDLDAVREALDVLDVVVMHEHVGQTHLLEQAHPGEVHRLADDNVHDKPLAARPISFSMINTSRSALCTSTWRCITPTPR